MRLKSTDNRKKRTWLFGNNGWHGNWTVLLKPVFSTKKCSHPLMSLIICSFGSFSIGANVNIADKFGRTPLHVAAASDHQDMVKLLVDNGANVEASTSGENQTPLHYAARNEAVQCVKTLLAYSAEIDARDYKQRTPLLVRRSLQYFENKLQSVAKLMRHLTAFWRIFEYPNPR